MITLKSCDKRFFVIEETVALQSKTLKRMMAGNENDEHIVVPLTTIKGNILAEVLDYCTKHAKVETSEEDKKIWDAQFVNFELDETNSQMLLDMFHAAKFLDIEGLMDLTREKASEWMPRKTPEENEAILRRIENHRQLND
ncbi:hypothetical protein MKX03_006764 [Papaver bracteatum]|nr:hypothetical protein MKX03_006764 [Papaver bracteatum]